MAATTPARAENPVETVVELAALVSSWISLHAAGILTSAYERAPVLVTVLAAMLILPVTALALLIAQSMRLRARLCMPQSRDVRGTAEAGTMRDRDAKPLLPPREHLAFLISDAGQRWVLPPECSSVRIGRHETSDLRLPFAAVHRHHAVLHRLARGAFSITDVAGAAGNGVRVNGVRVTEHSLVPGDVVEFGETCLTFHVASYASLASSDSRPTPH